jgi:hypothetical protein
MTALRAFGLAAAIWGPLELGAVAQEKIEPEYSIWDVVLGEPVSQILEAQVSELACGTNGGPPAQSLTLFEDFATCPAEESGLHEVTFFYDDEQDYIAKAMESEYRFLQGGTSIFAHPVIVAVLVDPAGLVQGIRIVTDNRISDRERRTAVTLMRNFKARYSEWGMDCVDLPMREGEQPVGTQFIHELCEGTSGDGALRIAIEASYLRKKGQRAINLETQTVNTGYFESQTRFEQVLAPYSPTVLP